jgi:hypothetical protein
VAVSGLIPCAHLLILLFQSSSMAILPWLNCVCVRVWIRRGLRRSQERGFEGRVFEVSIQKAECSKGVCSKGECSKGRVFERQSVWKECCRVFEVGIQKAECSKGVCSKGVCSKGVCSKGGCSKGEYSKGRVFERQRVRKAECLEGVLQGVRSGYSRFWVHRARMSGSCVFEKFAGLEEGVLGNRK